jgi:hypothetical protein
VSVSAAPNAILFAITIVTMGAYAAVARSVDKRGEVIAEKFKTPVFDEKRLLVIRQHGDEASVSIGLASAAVRIISVLTRFRGSVISSRRQAAINGRDEHSMDYYETVMLHYLRSDRATFVNPECCIQLNPSNNPDTSGPHWYCDAVVANLREKAIFLCEISYSKGLPSLTKRLKDWHASWDLVCHALTRDSFLPNNWPIRPWLFVPEHLVPLLLRRFDEMRDGQPLRSLPRVTTLEMIQPWRFQSWNRVGEAEKPECIPAVMRD